MKTIKLSIFLLGLTLLFSVSSNAESMKCGAGKCGTSMTPLKVNKEDMKKVNDSNTTHKLGSTNRWNRNSYGQEHQRGTISTH